LRWNGLSDVDIRASSLEEFNENVVLSTATVCDVSTSSAYWVGAAAAGDYVGLAKDVRLE